MKHIVVITSGYYPYYSAVGKCIGNIADELSDIYRVTVVTVHGVNNQQDVEFYKGQEIRRISTKNGMQRLRLSSYEEASEFRKITNKILLYKIKIIEWVKCFIKRYNLKRDYIEAIYEQLASIDTPINAIIPTCSMIEGVIAAIQFNQQRSPKTRILPFLFDQYSENLFLHRGRLNTKLKFKKHLDIERNVIENSTIIMASHSLRQHYSKYFPESKSKFIYVEHPLIKLQQYQCTENINHEVELFYAGSILKHYVEADYLLRILEIARRKLRFIARFCVRGNGCGIVTRYADKYKGEILDYGSVKQTLVDEYSANADILINIAEKRGRQISSKIFSYMSHGKPIIHFYTAEDDVNLQILKKYPLCLCLVENENQLEQNADSFVNFCIQNKGCTLTYKEVEDIYYDATPKFIARIIIEAIERMS